MFTKKKLALVGCGKLGRIVADAVINGILKDYELIGVYSRTRKKRHPLPIALVTMYAKYATH